MKVQNLNPRNSLKLMEKVMNQRKMKRDVVTGGGQNLNVNSRGIAGICCYYYVQDFTLNLNTFCRFQVEKNRGKSRVLVFSPSSNLENGRGGRGRDFARGRGRVARPAYEEREENFAYSRKNFRGKGFDKGSESFDSYSTEDGRIGKQLRLLSRETDEDVIIKICRQLQESFLIQENLRYIRYNLLPTANSLMETLKLVNSTQARFEIALTLSRLGYVSDHDFHRY